MTLRIHPLFTVARPRALLACGLLLEAFTAEAHHSISGMYDSRRDVRVEGVVTQFEFVNPHAFITLEVRETGRASQQQGVDHRPRHGARWATPKAAAAPRVKNYWRPSSDRIVVRTPLRPFRRHRRRRRCRP